MKYSIPLFLLISLCTFYTHAHAENAYAEIDTSGPSITCPADANHECYADVPDAFTTYQAFIMGGGSASDSCGIDASTFAFTESETGSCPRSITRVYEIADSCGNVSSCTQTITVDDITPPSITCPVDSTYDCRGDVPPAITDYNEFINGGGIVSDNCGLVETTFTVTETINGSSPLIFERTYSIVDSCGNLSACVQTITVNDITPPTITCPADETHECYADVPPAFLNFTDFVNGGGSASDNDGLDETSFTVTETNAGTCPRTITRTYEIEDSCGNISSCVQTITVDDVTPPTITCPADETYECYADLPPAFNNFTDFLNAGGSASDNCGLDESTFAVTETDVGTCPRIITRVYEIADSCGNVSTCTQTITIDDVTPLEITCPADLNFECYADVPAVLNTLQDFFSSGGFASDNCSYNENSFAVTETYAGTCPKMITRVYEIADSCGNVSSCTQTIFVDDVTPPVISCPPDLTIQTHAELPPPFLTLSEFINNGGTASDNCGLDESSYFFVETGSCSDSIERTYSIGDSCGNVATCVQTISVLEIPPTQLTEEACSFFQAPSGKFLFSSGTHFDTLQYSVNCERVIEIDLTLLDSAATHEHLSGCDSILLPNDQMATSSGYYIDTFPKAGDCDSFHVVTYEVFRSSYTWIEIFSCDSIATYEGDNFLVPGLYIDSFTTTTGCDSVVIIDVQLEPLSNGLRVSRPGTLISLAQGVSYQWVDCNDDHSIIPGATDSTFTPDSSGSYAVIVTRGQCVDTSDCLDVDITPATHAEWKEFTVYPNPADQQIQFHIEQLLPGTTYRIIDVTGQVVRQQHLNGNTIDIHPLPPGLYLLQIENRIARFIKE